LKEDPVSTQSKAAGIEKHVRISSGSVSLGARLTVPANARKLVVFAHGSGSSRLSPRNNFVAEVLAAHGFGFLLMDLLTAAEDLSHKNRFNIELLATRLISAQKWIREHDLLRDFSIGLFGANTGAAAALKVAVRLGKEIGAVVSRGGRPDLAEEDLPRVVSPTLLIVGGNDPAMLELNEKAFQKLTCIKKLEIVPGATHLFEEPDTLEQAAYLANAWFKKYL
jgi:pimeloyl-ACP methyl ester carboxylesterase